MLSPSPGCSAEVPTAAGARQDLRGGTRKLAFERPREGIPFDLRSNRARRHAAAISHPLHAAGAFAGTRRQSLADNRLDQVHRKAEPEQHDMPAHVVRIKVTWIAARPRYAHTRGSQPTHPHDCARERRPSNAVKRRALAPRKGSRRRGSIGEVRVLLVGPRCDVHLGRVPGAGIRTVSEGHKKTCCLPSSLPAVEPCSS